MDAHAHILVSGMVQGVGFRFFISRIARKVQLTGWVKNHPSGEVEIDVEGPKGLIESFIKNIPVCVYKMPSFSKSSTPFTISSVDASS